MHDASAKSPGKYQENNWLPTRGRSVFEAWLERSHAAVNDEFGTQYKS
jgi:hypothetical protein